MCLFYKLIYINYINVCLSMCYFEIQIMNQQEHRLSNWAQVSNNWNNKYKYSNLHRIRNNWPTTVLVGFVHAITVTK